MRLALLEMMKSYKPKSSNVEIIFHFGGSGSLAQQIIKGTPTDIFISSYLGPMEELKEHGLLIKSWPRPLCRNRLVLVTWEGNKLIHSFNDLAKTDVESIAVAGNQCSGGGYYAHQLLKKLGLLEKIESKLIYAKDAVQAITYLNRGHVDACITFASAAHAYPHLEIVTEAPRTETAPILFTTAILKGAAPLAETADFALFLLSPEAQEIFKKHGFQPLKQTL
ncbi:MAG: molybdate ABC transporter substrate-binding protein [Opitutales bacterium]|tara:strand:- start:692 stop:1360 length:669 start_codon:yes stop_codon:yes gene_type:complete